MESHMVQGFNHNVMYKGELFHFQTEDSGIANPQIVTLLYKGGAILCSKKTSYADIIKMEKLERIVEDLMKEQHKEMMRRLKSGEFDERAFSSSAIAAPADAQEIPTPAAASVASHPPVHPTRHSVPSETEETSPASSGANEK